MARKRSYKQNEVCRELDIQPYVLRYWETEFRFLKSTKKVGGQRAFSQAEVEVLGRIRSLLYEEGYTIAGARKRIEAERAGTVEAPSPPPSKAAAAVVVPESSAIEGANESVRALRSGVADALVEARSLLAFLERET